MISAEFTVNGNSNPAAHSVAYGSTVNLELLSYVGATNIAWSIESCSDPDESIPVITRSGTPPGRTASFVIPSAPGDDYGRTFLVKCSVVSEQKNADGAMSYDVKYGVIGVANSRGLLPIAPGEENYRHGSHGWGPEVNIALNNTATGVGSSATALPAPSLVATSNIAITGVVTIDSIASNTVSGDILLTAQTNTAENGYWTPAAGSWSRPSYYNSDSTVEAVLGITSGAVLQGTLGTGSVWFQSVGTTIAGAKTWNKLNTPSLLQDALNTTLPAQTYTQHKGAVILRDPTNSRNTVDLGRADPREYGALAITTETTGTCSVGGTIGLLSENGHENGSWLLFHGAGPNHGMATPAAPTAVVQGTPGSTQWEFQIVAMTRSYGYTAASPVLNGTNAPATLTDNTYTLAGGVMSGYTPGNFVELHFTPVPGAMWYLVYARKNGAGAYSFKGAAIAYPGSYYHDVLPCFRFVSEATRGVPSGIPATPPVTPCANALRTQVISGGRTTTLTVKPVPYTAATGTVVEHCSAIPIEDAMNATAGGVFSNVSGGLVVLKNGTYPITADVRINRSLTLRGAHEGKSSSSVILQAKHGVQFAIDQGNMAPPRQPGELVRVGDRRQAALHGVAGVDATTVFYCTSVSPANPTTAGGWGKTATGGDPAWNYTPGASTTDGEVTWKAHGNGGTYYTNAFNANVSGIHIKYVGSNGIPGGRSVCLKDMRLSWRNYQNPGGGVYWLPGYGVSLGHVILPAASGGNHTGKMYICTAAGTTGGTEPTWSKVHGASVSGDGGVSYTVYDQPMVQGAAVLLTTVHNVSIGVENSCGTSVLGNGDSGRGYAINDSTADIRSVNPYAGHGAYWFGSDAQQCKIHINAKNSSGGIGWGDDSLYGNIVTGLIGDGGSKFQNTPHVSQSVQTSAWMTQCYSESGPVDWNYPGRVQGGAGLQNQLGTAIYDGLLAGVESPRQFDVATVSPYASHYRFAGGYYGYTATAGTKGSPFTYFQSWNTYSASTTGRRIIKGLNSNNGSLTIPTEEEPQYDSRGFSRVFPIGSRHGAGRYAGSERFYWPISAIPTLGAFANGDFLPWAADARRLAIIATRRGAEGYTSRANSTGYAQGNIVASASGGRLFVCANGSSTGGNSAASEPAGMATAEIDNYVTDGAVLWQCVGTIQQSAALRAVPNWSAEYVTLTNSDQTITGVTSPCFTCATATANRSITLGATGAMRGDGLRVRITVPVGFTWTFINGGTGGGNAAVIPVNTTGVFDFVMDDAGAWRLERATPYGIADAEQSGTATLVAGVSAAISANVSANSVIVVTLKTPNTDTATVKYAALGTDRTNGTPGSFKISALTAAGSGAINTADVSTLDWRVLK